MTTDKTPQTPNGGRTEQWSAVFYDHHREERRKLARAVAGEARRPRADPDRQRRADES